MDHFLQMVSNASVSVDHAILDLLVMAENLLVVTPSVAVNESAQLDAERIVHVFTVIGDIASGNLSKNEERRYDMPGGWRPPGIEFHRLFAGMVQDGNLRGKGKRKTRRPSGNRSAKKCG